MIIYGIFRNYFSNFTYLAKTVCISTCLVSSDTLEFAKLILEQNTAVHAHHLRRIIRPHMENTMPVTLKNILY